MKQEDLNVLYSTFLEGDMESFSKLYRMLIGSMLRYGLCYSQSKQTVEDAIQDVFVYLYNKGREGLQINNVKTYLLTALRNRLFNIIKSDRLLHFGDFSLFDNEITPSSLDKLISNEDKHLMDKTIRVLSKSLSNKEKEIIYLRFVETLSYQEIANILGIKEQSARNQMHRSICKMRDAAKDSPLESPQKTL